MRNSRAPGALLTFPAAAWADFIDRVRHGEFDLAGGARAETGGGRQARG
jgi:hypothetical protein